MIRYAYFALIQSENRKSIMKQFLILFFVGLTFAVSAQQIDYNDNGKYIAKGYDVVAYFSSKSIVGNTKYVHSYNGTKFKLSN